MAKRKKKQFAENKLFDHVIEPSFSEILNKKHELIGKWHQEVFKNDNPIVLELGCGKGEYSVGLGRKYPEKNFLGVDIKGNRIWRGAKTVHEEGLNNVAFLRSKVDFIDRFFAPDEVSEIWLTFSDPQPKKPRKRLTSDKYLDFYKGFLKKDGLIHLKTDNRLLFNYTLEQIQKHKFTLHFRSFDIYHEWDSIPSEMQKQLEIKTYYEQLFMGKGFRINYLCFSM
ncbi:tRNA (guanosine(46)-N7)-methyltransferase TrmB [Luteibaculum oceani]|uniref:tRNA (guanine-N(7)-)-methyltransferase n=1 Tax=Luteibaculum oceani TaxID=1294296 RepID=A0A5C6V1P7_9FLAO|nr:tRNA (guanosine(46)-N7)-methyltransferase TrmB [Luteibaculum oceani]TXC78924.1 tRNA (guanosine(46)-N7)-methyltransferase TrmB [Luteibaculum oceani]